VINKLQKHLTFSFKGCEWGGTGP